MGNHNADAAYVKAAEDVKEEQAGGATEGDEAEEVRSFFRSQKRSCAGDHFTSHQMENRVALSLPCLWCPELQTAAVQHWMWQPSWTCLSVAAQAVPIVSMADDMAIPQEGEGQKEVEQAAEAEQGSEVDAPLTQDAAYPTRAKVGTLPCSSP